MDPPPAPRRHFYRRAVNNPSPLFLTSCVSNVHHTTRHPLRVKKPLAMFTPRLCRSALSHRSALSRRCHGTVSAALAAAVARLPHREALRGVSQDVRYSYKELHATVDEVANGFVALRFGAGDVLALWLPHNSVENIVTQLAAAQVGLTLAVIAPEVAQAEDLAFVLRDSCASGLVFAPRQLGRNQTHVVQSLFPELSTCEH